MELKTNLDLQMWTNTFTTVLEKEGYDVKDAIRRADDAVEALRLRVDEAKNKDNPA